MFNRFSAEMALLHVGLTQLWSGLQQGRRHMLFAVVKSWALKAESLRCYSLTGQVNDRKERWRNEKIIGEDTNDVCTRRLSEEQVSGRPVYVLSCTNPSSSSWSPHSLTWQRLSLAFQHADICYSTRHQQRQDFRGTSLDCSHSSYSKVLCQSQRSSTSNEVFYLSSFN